VTTGEAGQQDEPTEDLESADPALARERTDLAWTRSSIAFLGLGAALLKYRPVSAILVLAIGVAVWLVGHMPPGPGPAGVVLGSRRVLLVTVAVTGLALVALVLMFTGSSPGLRP
jgi:uncharacterized membrane protein YidH (DUF202 family)